MENLALESPLFGNLAYTQDQVFNFPQGIIGFPELKSFLVLDYPELRPFFWLQNLEQPEWCFLMLDPWAFFPAYSPELPDEAVEKIGLKDTSENFALLTFAVIHKGKMSAEVNLLAPVVLNLKSKTGCQAILENQNDYSVSQPLEFNSLPMPNPNCDCAGVG